MVLRTLERPVHPELFEASAQSILHFSGRRAKLHIGRTGHMLEFHDSNCTVTEVVATKHEEFPEHGRVVDRRLIGYRTHQLDLPFVRYHCSYQLEHVPLDVYLQLHREFEMDAANSTLSYAFPGSSAQSPTCLSFLKCDILQEGLVVHAFHTFPDNAAILRTQTLFEILEPS